MRLVTIPLALLLAAAPLGAQALDVVTTTTDLASIARAIGGERVRVRSIAAGTQDPHFVEPKPSLILALRDADVFAQVGLELEAGWAPLLLEQARNPAIRPGGRGHLDLSTAVTVLDVPEGRVSRAQGDIHPYGNPHYWLDPANGQRMAAAFAARFAELDPSGAAVYHANLQSFTERLQEAGARWRELLAPYRGTPVVAYHNSWKYFLRYTGLEIVGYVEPKPGIPPSPAHLAELIESMRQRSARAVIVDPFYDSRTPRMLAERAGARLLVLPSSVGGAPGVNDYIQLIDHDVRSLVNAIRE